MLIGADSWYPPSQQVLNALKVLDGFKFYGGYVGGSGLYLNTPWPKYNWDLLQSNGIEPLPIYVPNQDCSEDPEFVATDAMAKCEAVGLTGTVAIDSEKSMGQIANFQHWLDSVYSVLNQAGWNSLDYMGSGYLSPLAFHWVVLWGQHEDVPEAGEAIQYGPYTLRDTNGDILMEVDADSADENFPFARYIGGKNMAEPVPNQPADSQSEPSAKAGVTLAHPIVDSVMLPGKTGAISVGADGGVFLYGNAKMFGSIPGNYPKVELHAPIVAIECVDNTGYTLVAADGGRFNFGEMPDWQPI